jgi:hypothetical protein
MSEKNWGGRRQGAGRPRKIIKISLATSEDEQPYEPLEAMEKALELVGYAGRILAGTPMKEDGITDLPEQARYCSVELLSIEDKLEESIHEERTKKMRDIIETSEYLTVTTEYNGMYTTVDGSAFDGTFHISTGVQGMPATEHQEASSIEEVTKIIQEKGLLNQGWEPIAESES